MSRAAALTTPAAGAATATACLHCGQEVTAREGDFCCAGCHAVYELIHGERLQRYYDLRGARAGAPVVASEPPTSRPWLEPTIEACSASDAPTNVVLDIQGIHCSGCVWLLEETFRRQDGLRLIVNPALGQLDLTIDARFPLARWLDTVERLGYRVGPALKQPDRTSDGLLVRLGVTVALAANTMLLSSATYFGLDSGSLADFVHWLAYGLATLTVVIGGPVFFRGAIAALRHGGLHLDVPISLGIALAFAGSTWAAISGTRTAFFADSLAIFVALMVVGRYLQRRVVDANRHRLLASDSGDGLVCRTIRDGRVERGHCRDIAVGDRLLIAPGELVPVDAVLEHDGELSLDWIQGESQPRPFALGERTPAGAFNAGATSITVCATQSFVESPLLRLLRAPIDGAADATPDVATRAIIAPYVVAVLALAALGFVAWATVGDDPTRGLVVAVSVLVISCPCAFGIAAPLAHELVLARLRRAGLYVRDGAFLHRAARIARVVFDKTGTLTAGVPALRDPEVVRALSPELRTVLYNLASRSAHPRSRAVLRALGDDDARLIQMSVREVPGRGIEAAHGGHRYRLGAREWALELAADTDDRIDDARALTFSRDGALVAALPTLDPLRPDARAEVEGLRASGLDVYVLSGDEPTRVVAVADELGLARDHAIGGASPDDKRAWLEQHDADRTLFIGDGINDSLAAEVAACSGTPAIDRPFLAAKTDFYFVSPGLGPISLALRAARELRRVVRQNFTLAVTYNALAIAVALTGLMTPWLAAVAMPLSSIAIVTATVVSLSPRFNSWKS